jgi:exosortase/archaeosortase family protein
VQVEPDASILDGNSPTVIRRLQSFLQASVPWTNTRPYRRFLQAVLIVILAILMIKLLEGSDTRLEVYVLDVAVIFFLGFVVLEGKTAKKLQSRTTRFDLGLAIVALTLVLIVNLGIWSPIKYLSSRQPGFIDAIALVLILFVAAYGLRNVRPMIAPISLLIALAAITVFISNEDPTFYAYVGRYFVAFTVWASAGILSLLGFSVATGPDSFRIIGVGGLNIQLGIRCGGLDVATVYSLFVGYFAWQTRLGKAARLSVTLIAALGAIGLNALRVVLITILFLHYPIDLVEAFHTNIGDVTFLGYAAAFIGILAKYR